MTRPRSGSRAMQMKSQASDTSNRPELIGGAKCEFSLENVLLG